ncbi:MAG: hypothetical protein ACI8RC_001814 [Ilumatobacter sp.]|jgi:hypothetical protein
MVQVHRAWTRCAGRTLHGANSLTGMSLGISASNGNTTESSAGGTDTSTVLGVTGQRWRASVSPWGSVMPWAQTDGAAERIDWHIAADDRWHTPATEAAVRQIRLAGAPVTETRVRIPDGDAVQRVWSVADRGGLTIIEIENDSPLPFAVAFSGLPVLTERPPADMPLQGIELPAGTITLPIAHRTSIRVAIAHGPIPDAVDRHAANLKALPDADVVSRGWVTLAERASRLNLPDDGLADAVVAARCDLMLTGPIDVAQDPIGFILDVNELVRCGEEAEPWMYEIAEPLESIARSGNAFVPAAIAAAHHIAVAADDRRATRDIARLAKRVGHGARSAPGPFSEIVRGASVGRFVHEVERRLADGTNLLPIGIPTRWLGANFELHGVPTSASSTVSFAVRWHGERPAVLWEQTGKAQRLSASAVDADWSSNEQTGESLWAAPARSAAPRSLSLTAETGLTSPQPTSFT